MSIQKKLDLFCRHVDGVIQNAKVIAPNLDDAEAKLIISNAYVHDQSKLTDGLEYRCLVLNECTEKELKDAIECHNHTNLHHPEHWKYRLSTMPKIYKIEMCMDWLARAREQGKSVWNWLDNEAAKRYYFCQGYKIHSELSEYLKMMTNTFSK